MAGGQFFNKTLLPMRGAAAGDAAPQSGACCAAEPCDAAQAAGPHLVFDALGREVREPESI